MPAPIQPISAPQMPELARPAGSPAAGGGGFADVLSNAIQGVDGLGRQAGASVESFLSGDGEDLHTAVLAPRAPSWRSTCFWKPATRW